VTPQSATTDKPTLVFDLGGVLIDWDPRYLYRKLFDDEATMEEFLSTVVTSEWNKTLDRGRDWNSAVAALSEEYPHWAALIAAYRDRWDEMLDGPIEGTLRILEGLSAQRYEVVALTNWSAETFPVALQRYRFLDLFDHIVVSGEEGVIKPDRRLFQILLERIGRRPEQCIFIDDSQTNVDAATAIGFDAILFRNPQQLGAELAARGIGTS
jgi:2-haloacid dehalogenase